MSHTFSIYSIPVVRRIGRQNIDLGSPRRLRSQVTSITVPLIRRDLVADHDTVTHILTQALQNMHRATIVHHSLYIFQIWLKLEGVCYGTRQVGNASTCGMQVLYAMSCGSGGNSVRGVELGN